MTEQTKPERKPLRECNRLFFDCETSGLDFMRDCIIEAAWVLTDPTGTKILRERAFKILPTMDVSPEAAAINGYDRGVWETEAVFGSTAFAQLANDSVDAVFVAHNAPFDWPFVHVGFRNYSVVANWRGDYHEICTAALAMPLLDAGLIDGVRLTKLAAYFGIPQPVEHRALDDARMCRKVYVRLMAHYGAAREALAAVIADLDRLAGDMRYDAGIRTVAQRRSQELRSTLAKP